MAVSVSQLTAKVSIEGVSEAQATLRSLGVAVDELAHRLSRPPSFDASRLVSGAGSAQSHLNGLAREVQQTQSQLNHMSSAANEGGSRLSSLGRMGSAAVAGISRLGEASGSTVSSLVSGFARAGTSVMSFLGSVGLAAQGIRSISDSVMGLGKALFSGNAAMEQARVSFMAFLGSGKEVDALMSRLQQFAAETPFQFPEIQQTSLKLLNMGVQAKDLTTYMADLGNAVAKVGGSGQMLEDVALIISQMGMKGKVTNEEMLQLVERNIKAYDLLAKAMDVPVDQLQDMISKGELGRDKIDLLVKKMGEFGNGAMVAQGQTFNGLLSTIQDSAVAAWQAFTSPMFEMAKGGLVVLTQLVSSDKFKQFATNLGVKVGGVLTNIGSLLQTTVVPLFRQFQAVFQDEPGGVFLASLQMLGKALLDVVLALSPVGNLLKAIAGDLTGAQGPGSAFASLLYNLSEIIQTGIVPVLQTLAKGVGSALVPLFTQLIGVLSSPAFAQFVQNILAQIGRFLGTIGQVLATVVVPIVSTLLSILSSPGFQNFVSGFLALFNDALSFLVGILGPILVPVLSIVQQLFAGWLQVGAQIVNQVRSQLLPALQNLWQTIGPIIVGFLTWMSQSGLIQRYFEVISTAVGTAIDILTALINTVTWVVNGIVTTFRLWGTTASWLQGVWSGFSAWFASAMGALGSWFQGLWSNISSWFSGWWSQFSAWFASAMGALGSWFQGLWSNISSWFSGWWSRTVAISSMLWGAITVIWQTATSFLYANTVGRFLALVQAVWTALSPIISYISSIFATIWNIIVAIINRVIGWLSAQWMLAKMQIALYWSAIQAYIAAVLEFIRTSIWNVVGPLVDWLAARWSDIKNGVSATWSWISFHISEIWSGIYNTISSKVVQARDWLAARWSDIKNGVSSAWNTISSKVSEVWNNISATISSKVSSIKDGILRPFNSAKDSIGGIIKQFANNMIGMLNKGIEGVEKFLNAFGDGLNSVAEKLGTKGLVERVSLPRIPTYASGTRSHPGGPALVGEEGPEFAMLGGREPTLLGIRGPQLLNLPSGTTVMPADKTRSFLDMSGTRIPAYAGGIGEIAGKFWEWAAGGAKSILDGMLSSFGIKAPELPGVFSRVAGGVLGKFKDLALKWIEDHMPKLNFDLSQTVKVPQIGEFVTPGINTGFHAPLWYGVHQGLDFAFGQGTPVPAVLGGTVTDASFKPWGGEIDLRTPLGLIERYLHLSELFVRIGQKIARGAVIGLSGGGTPQSGLGYWSSGAHLHLQYDAGNINAGINPFLVWSAAGIKKPFARGGIVREPVFGFGARSGAAYSFAERGPEAVTPLGYLPAGAQLRAAALTEGGGKQVTIVVNPPSVYLDGRLLANGLMPHFVDAIRYSVGTHDF